MNRSKITGWSSGEMPGPSSCTRINTASGVVVAPTVTVRSGWAGAPDETTPFQGFTDNRGQLTFSDPSLVKAQTVTVFKENYQSATVTSVNAENLTVFISYTGPGEGSPGSPPPGVPGASHRSAPLPRCQG